MGVVLNTQFDYKSRLVGNRITKNFTFEALRR